MKPSHLQKAAWFAAQRVERLFAIPSRMVVAGWIGSGSTFITQVLRQLGVDVVKVHGCYKYSCGSKMIYTIRDPRDIAVSTAHRHYGELLRDGGAAIALRAAIDHLAGMNMGGDLHACLKASNCWVIRYEAHFHGGEERLIGLLMDQITPNCSRDEIRSAVANNSLDRNRERSMKLGGFRTVDSDNLLHGNHVSTGGRMNVWREWFDPEITAYFEKQNPHLLKLAGYDA